MIVSMPFLDTPLKIIVMQIVLVQLHIHNDCELSCVGYLSLPDDIDKEWEDDYKDHFLSNGHINFSYGVNNKYGCANMLIKPRVGDFFVFPRYQYLAARTLLNPSIR